MTHKDTYKPLPLWKAVLYIAIATVILAFCTQPSMAQVGKKKSHLVTGNYTVETKIGDSVTFAGVKGKWIVFSDTLKVGDVIFIRGTKNKNKANVKPVIN